VAVETAWALILMLSAIDAGLSWPNITLLAMYRAFAAMAGPMAARYLMIWMTFSVRSCVCARGRHVAITNLQEAVPDHRGKLLRRRSLWAFGLFRFIMVYVGIHTRSVCSISDPCAAYTFCFYRLSRDAAGLPVYRASAADCPAFH